MESIALINRKGGVGKTISTVNIAACLDREHKKKVLVIDCDEQRDSTKYLTAFLPDGPEEDITSYISGKCSLKDIALPVFEETAGRTVGTKMYIVPGNPEFELTEFPDPEVFKKLLKEAEEMGFDYVLFDCPPHISTPALICLNAVKYVLVVASSDINSLDGYGKLLGTIKDIRTAVNIDIRLLGVFFNQMRTRESVHRWMYENNIENLGDAVFKSYIRSSAVVEQAQVFGRPVAYYRQSSDVYGDYKKLTREIISRIRKEHEA